MATGFNEDVTALCQTVLFVRRGSQCVPFYRPQKFPLSLQRHKMLRDNAYSCHAANTSNKEITDPALIEPWLDYETSLYDLPKPGQSARQKGDNPSFRARDSVSRKDLSFPEDLDMSFHSGQLDTTLNTTRLNSTANPDRTTVVMSQSATNSQMVVPDCDDLSVDCGDQAESMGDSLYSLNELDKTCTDYPQSTNTSVLGEHSFTGRLDTSLLHSRAPPITSGLPLLFYPRTKRKTTTRVTKSVRRHRKK